MVSGLKSVLKQLLPNGICELSVRRNAYLRMGFPNRRALFEAFDIGRYQAVCDARLDLIPPEITQRLSTCVDAGAHTGTWTRALPRLPWIMGLQTRNILARAKDERAVPRRSQKGLWIGVK